jgi:hypothetical protein
LGCKLGRAKQLRGTKKPSSFSSIGSSWRVLVFDANVLQNFVEKRNPIAYYKLLQKSNIDNQWITIFDYKLLIMA